MAHTTTFKVSKRRKREGKTNYKKRLTLLLSHKPRIVVRKTHNRIILQIVQYQADGDKILSSAQSKELKAFGYKGHGGNAKAGYLVGYLGGMRAIKNKVDGAILDIGMVSPVRGSAVFAVLLGAIDSGLNVAHNKEILPPAENFSDLEKIKKKIAEA
jgi:large subunit ribosomal protein L18